MTRTTPLRRTILQFAHIFLTDDRTFMIYETPLAKPVGNSAAIEVVGREFYPDFVPGEDADEVLAHLSRDVREHLVSVLELYAEHRVRQGLDNHRLDFDCFFFRQIVPFVLPY